MLAFLSYQTSDKLVAADIQQLLSRLHIPTFMAHEDVEVSAQWQTEILNSLRQADLFVAILSKNYIGSAYCMQEAGVACYRARSARALLTIIPLSLDATVSPGFMSYIQSRRIDPEEIECNVLFNGLARYNFDLTFDFLVDELSNSGSYRSAERHFAMLNPLLDKASDAQIVRVLEVSIDNGQIWDAALCKTKYLPPLFDTHGRLMSDPKERKRLREALGK